MTEIETMRVGIARVAQTMGLDIPPDLPQVHGKSYGDLCSLAQTTERGWNALLGCMQEWAEQQKAALVDLQSSVNASGWHP